MSGGPSEGSSLPPNLLVDLGYSIAMFLLAAVGLRFTVKNCFAVDLFAFNTLPAQVAGGIVGVLVLFSIYRLVSNPMRVRRLARQLTGRQYAMGEWQQQAQRSKEALREAGEMRESFKQVGTLASVGNPVDIPV